MAGRATLLVSPTAAQQIVGREQRERLSQLAWCGGGCFDSRRRVNSTVIWLLILNRLAYHVGPVKVRNVLKLLRNDGWSLIRTVGSHRQLKHPSKPGRVTVSGHPSDDIHPKTLKSILTQAGLKK